MAKTETKTTKKTRPRQAGLPGTQGEITEIEQHADFLLLARDRVADAKTEQADAEEALKKLMHKHRRKVYRRTLPDGTTLDVSLTESKEGVRCRKTRSKTKAD
jgi:hypothetical protein